LGAGAHCHRFKHAVLYVITAQTTQVQVHATAADFVAYLHDLAPTLWELSSHSIQYHPVAGVAGWHALLHLL
jgi:hypothetical protein